MRKSKSGGSSNRKYNPAVGDKLIRLMMRKDGADIHDFIKVGYKQPAMAALKMAKRRSFKTKVLKRPGALTRYIAKK